MKSSANESPAMLSETNSPPAEATHYLHPVSLIFTITSIVRSNFVPAIFAVVGAANSNYWIIIFSSLFFIPAFVFAIIRYFTLSYRIADGELVVHEGLLFKRVRTVPIARIQNIDLVQGVLHRLLHVAEVRVETASGTEPEATLSVLALDKVALLRQHVEGAKTSQVQTLAPPGDQILPHSNTEPPLTEGTVSPWAAPSAPSLEVGADTQRALVSIPLKLLVKAGFASNRGLVMVGVVLGLYFQFDRQNPENIDRVANWIPEALAFDFSLRSFAIWLGVFIVATAMLKILGIAWFILRFFGYQLQQSGDDFKISCGLLTKVSATVPRKRIQLISIHQNLMSRWLGVVAIRIETAGGAGAQNENATTTVSRRWFIPALPQSRVAEVVQQLKPGLTWQPDSFAWKPLAPKTAMRLTRLAIVAWLVMMLVGWFQFAYWGLGIAAATLPLLLAYAWKKASSVSYARTDFGVAFRSGILLRKVSMTFFDKIQAVSIAQSPFDRRWRMATLQVDTAASGPADHKIEIKFLDSEFARTEYQSITQSAAIETPAFG